MDVVNFLKNGFTKMDRLRGLLRKKLIDNMVLVGHTCCKYQKLK